MADDWPKENNKKRSTYKVEEVINSKTNKPISKFTLTSVEKDINEVRYILSEAN